MSSVVERSFEVAAATFPRAPRDGLAHPFGFDEHDPYRWRVSRDVYDALRALAGWGKGEPGPADQLLGERLTVDPSLPPNSMLLEPLASAIGSTEPEIPSSTHDSHNTAGIDTGADERA